ncbi:MAG: insulinase family protein [Spirochaetaceae bacterium]|nr:insulinase family protein [Spirochaetaceae bacterium]
MKRTILALLCALALLPLGAEPTSYKGLHRFKLDNGLELFVYQDRAVPLARIEMAFRGGAMGQSAETAGWFHLLEHLVFRGHGGPGASAELRAELARIGAAEWNGATGAETSSYWLRLPADKTAQGLRFWAERFARGAAAPEAEALAAEKAVVAAELQAREADPDLVYEAAMTRRLFAKFPWRRDAAGSEKSVGAATVEGLQKLAATYLVPNNAALFVGGDVDPEEVFEETKKLFGSWKAGEDPWKQPLPAHPKLGVARPTWIAYPDPSLPEGIALVEARYRAPDLKTDPAASYAADLWTALVADPEGRFKKAVTKEVPKLYGKDAVSAYYLSQREGGILSISAYFAVDPALPAVDRARQFKERVRGYEITSMKTEPGYFSDKDVEAARRRLLDARLLSLETADGLVESLAFWWGAASADYFLGYAATLSSTGTREVLAFLDAYVMKNLEVVGLRMNPADYEREKKTFQDSGFEVIGPANAFWWRR